MRHDLNSLKCKVFFQLRIRRSLDDDSVATLVYVFVANRVDQCVGLQLA